MTKYKRGYRVIPFRWQTPHHKSVYWFAVQRTVYVFIWTYLFIGEAQCNIPHPFHCQRAKQCGMVLKHCLFCSRFFFSWLFAEDRVFWVGRSGAQQSSKVMFTKQPPTLTGKFPFVCCSYAWPLQKKGWTFASAPKPCSASFRTGEDLTTQCCSAKKLQKRS